jgi:thioesterase domain-containing protein
MRHGTQNFDIKAAQERELLADLLLRTDPTEVYPASLAQQRLWFLDQLQGKSAAYNVHLGLWLRGALDLGPLRASLEEMVNRHDSLRTAFILEGDELRQVVARNLTLSVPVDDLTDSKEPYAEAYRLAKQEVETPFSLRTAPLFRARIIRVAPNDHVLLCTMHHTVTDSWSIQILARELSAVYGAFSSGKPSPLSDLPISYGDYSEWQRQWFGTEQVQQQLNYWKARFENAPPFLELPKDNPRPPEQTFKGASQTIQLSPEIITAVKGLAPRWQATPFMLLLAAFKVLLYRYSGQPDLLVGVPAAGRTRVETEGLVGFFVNTLVLRDDLSGNPVFRDLLAQVRETTLGAFANAEVPFEKVVEALRPERNLSYNPLFQVMFSVIKAAVQSHSFGDLTAFPYVVTPTTSIFDLSTTLIEGVDGPWWAQIDYNSDLFRPERIARMLEDYISLLQAITVDPEACILDLPLVHGEPDLAKATSEICSTTKKQERKPVSVESAWRRESLDPEETLLVEIWKNVLGLPHIGIHDNFFEIGGHSLLAARLIAQIQDVTRRKIPVSAIFRAPTIEAFARLLRDNSATEPDPIVMKFNEVDGGIPFFGVAIPAVDTTGFAQLARDMSPVHPFYKLQAAAPVFWGHPFRREEMQALAKDYVAAMRSVQPRGPYCLGAMCLGVLIAQDMVLQLESEGEEVALFAIFDTWVLENSQIRSLWAIDYYYQRFRRLCALSLNEQMNTVRRTVGRWIAPISGNGGNHGDGWRDAYWPGEDFQTPRFNAPVLLFKRPRQPYFRVRDPQMGWAGRSLGGVEICEIECGHVEMFREPNVRLLAQKLGSRLESIAHRSDEPPASVSVTGRDLTISPDSETWAGSAA